MGATHGLTSSLRKLIKLCDPLSCIFLSLILQTSHLFFHKIGSIGSAQYVIFD